MSSDSIARKFILGLALLAFWSIVATTQNPYQRTDIFYNLFSGKSELFGPYNGLPDADINALKLNFDQTVRVLADNGNIYTYRQGRFRIPPGIDPDIVIKSFEVMPQMEILWFIDNKGVCYRYDQTRFSLLSFPRLINTIGRIKFLHSLIDGRPLLVNDEGEWFFLKQKSGGLLPDIRSIHNENPFHRPKKVLEIDTNIYALMYSGEIYILDSGGNFKKLESLNIPDSIIALSEGFEKNLLLIDKEGKLWSQQKEGNFKEVAIPHGCSELNKLSRIGKKLWLHCNEALMIFDNGNNLNVCSSYIPISPDIKYNVVRNEKSQIWIQEPRYLWNIDETELIKSPVNIDFRLLIQDPKNPSENISLASGNVHMLTENYLSIGIDLIDETFPIKPKYLYRLDDFSWQIAQVENQSIFLNNLLPGRHQLAIKAVHPGGKEKIISGITLNVQSSYFADLTKWLLWIMSIIILILLIGFIRIGVKKKIQSRNLKKTQEELKLLKLELKASRLQMNPHFLSNLFAVTEALIGSGEEEKASYYLIKGSKLMRRFLDSSRKEWIGFSEELKWIEDYISLENLRSQKEIEFISVTPKELDFEIPPLIIQPIVENAIYHGFKERKKGKIVLTSELKGRYLQITIEDDGSGLRTVKNTHKKSAHALELLKERLTLLVSNKKIEVLNLGSSNLGGAKVTVILPQRNSQS